MENTTENSQTTSTENSTTLPSVSPNTVSSTNVFDINIPVSGLIRSLDYQYIIEGLGGNWPVAVLPITGVFTAKSKSATINISAIFCPNPIVCPSGSDDVLPSTQRYSAGIENDLLFTSFRAKVCELNTNSNFIYSQTQKVSCSKCIRSFGPKAILPTLVELVEASGNTLEFEAKLDGISPDIEYTYKYNILNSSWPIKLSPASGTIKSAEHSGVIPSQLVFCETDPSYGDSCGVPKNLTATINLELDPVIDTNNTIWPVYNTQSIISNHMFVECDNCLPAPQITKTINGDVRINRNTSNFITFSIDKLIKNRSYNYIIERINANWPLIVNDKSDSIMSPDGKYSLNLLTEFCADTGVCTNANPNVLSYTTDIVKEKYSSFRLRLSDSVTSGVFYSDTVSLYCNDCDQHPQISIGEPSTGGFSNLTIEDVQDAIGTYISGVNGIEVSYDDSTGYTNIGIEDKTVKTASLDVLPENAISDSVFSVSSIKTFINKYDKTINIPISMKNLSIGKTYTYSLESVNANWPLFVINNNQTFTATEDSLDTSIYAVFCNSRASCPSGQLGILPYTANISKSAYSILRAVITDGTNTYMSDPIKYDCSDCITSLSSTKPILSQSMTLTDNNQATINEAKIEGLIPGVEYEYNFNIIDSSWPVEIYPKTGKIIATKDTAPIYANIIFCDSGNYSNVVCNTSKHTMAIINLEVSASGYASDNNLTNDIVSSNHMVIECHDCLPKPHITNTIGGDTRIDNSKSQLITFSIDKLIKNRQYDYTIEPIDANWPLIISNVSDSIISQNGKYSLDLISEFCADTGICNNTNPNVLSYLTDIVKEKYSSFRLRLSDSVNSGVMYSDIITLYCNDCDKDPTIRIGNDTATQITPTNEGTENSTTNGAISVAAIADVSYNKTISIPVTMTNLGVNKTYTCSLESVNANWPLLVINNDQSFTTITNDAETEFYVSFCSSRSSCPSGELNILPYAANSSLSAYGILRAVLTNGTDTYFSDPIRYDCDNCVTNLSSMRPLLPDSLVLSNSNKISINGARIEGLIRGIPYEYNFNIIDSNWPVEIYPKSGTIIADNTNASVYADIVFCDSGNYSNKLCNTETYPMAMINLDVSAPSYSSSNDIPNAIFYSNTLLAKCVNCIKQPSITLSSVSIASPKSPVVVTANLTDIKPNQTYEYMFENIDSNWPLFIRPKHGTFQFSEDTGRLNFSAELCDSKIACPSGSDYIIDYNTYYIPSDPNFSNFRLKITDTSTGGVYYSNGVQLQCQDCDIITIPTITTEIRDI